MRVIFGAQSECWEGFDWSSTGVFLPDFSTEEVGSDKIGELRQLGGSASGSVCLFLFLRLGSQLLSSLPRGILPTRDTIPTWRWPCSLWNKNKQTDPEADPPNCKNSRIFSEPTSSMGKSGEETPVEDQSKHSRHSDCAPNISLNLCTSSQPGELLLVAICGIVLQFGMVVFSGFTVYHPSFKRRFHKDDGVVEGFQLGLSRCFFAGLSHRRS